MMLKSRSKDVETEVTKTDPTEAELERARKAESEKAAKEAADKKRYFDSRVEEKIKELEKEDKVAREANRRERAVAIIESEVRPIPGNPTIEEIQASKAAAHKHGKHPAAHTHT